MKKQILLSILFVLGVSIVYVKVLSAWTNTIIDQREEIASARGRNGQLRILIDNRSAIEEQWKQLSGRYEQNLSDESQMSALLSQLELLANGNDLSLDDLRPQRVQKMELHNKFLVEIDMEGEFKHLISFLNRLQDEPYLFDIEELRIEKSPQGSRLKSFLCVSRIFIPS